MPKTHSLQEKQEAIAERTVETPTPLSQTRRDRIVWTLAGFDPSSGAGVTADLMSFAAAGLFGCSAITAFTVQSTLGVFGSEAVNPELLRSTLVRLDEDLPPSGIKIGMLGTPELARVLAGFLREKRDSPRTLPTVVLDPVLRSSSGRPLFPEEGLDSLRRELLPIVDWITPNWEEAALLAEMRVEDLASAEEAGRRITKRFPNLGVVVTGGDQREPVDLVLREGQLLGSVAGRHVETKATHGTGCAFSSSLLSQLVLGKEPMDAVQQAKRYVEGALRWAPGLGGGKGPMELLWPLLASGFYSEVGTLEK